MENEEDRPNKWQDRHWDMVMQVLGPYTRRQHHKFMKVRKDFFDSCNENKLSIGEMHLCLEFIRHEFREDTAEKLDRADEWE